MVVRGGLKSTWVRETCVLAAQPVSWASRRSCSYRHERRSHMVLITGATGTNGRLVVQGLRPHGAKAAHRGARDSDRLAAEGLVGGPRRPVDGVPEHPRHRVVVLRRDDQQGIGGMDPLAKAQHRLRKAGRFDVAVILRDAVQVERFEPHIRGFKSGSATTCSRIGCSRSASGLPYAGRCRARWRRLELSVGRAARYDLRELPDPQLVRDTPLQASPLARILLY